ncbi:MAG: 30S ribosome-binding factor RbfA [Planctomycetota bacterium]|nr:30S ribosome-binding factor RbfA [Planctomycetota bacterium]MDA1179879.1 30S ribosome-binding factor RbfA [Planctomycetota bacterium]
MSRRTLKAASAIREVVSMAILTQLRDPRVRDVTVTLVEVSTDMRSAKVHVSIMGDARQQRLALQGLQNSAGFLQETINRRIDMRYTPRLLFVLDQGVKNSLEVARILDNLRTEGARAKNASQSDVEDETLEDETLEDEALEDEALEDEALEDEALVSDTTNYPSALRCQSPEDVESSVESGDDQTHT